jgi:hypothetical protein
MRRPWPALGRSATKTNNILQYTHKHKEIARNKFDLMGVQEVRWDKWGTVRAGDYIFSMEHEMKMINWEEVIVYTIE